MHATGKGFAWHGAVHGMIAPIVQARPIVLHINLGNVYITLGFVYYVWRSSMNLRNNKKTLLLHVVSKEIPNEPF